MSRWGKAAEKAAEEVLSKKYLTDCRGHYSLQRQQRSAIQNYVGLREVVRYPAQERRVSNVEQSSHLVSIPFGLAGGDGPEN